MHLRTGASAALAFLLCLGLHSQAPAPPAPATSGAAAARRTQAELRALYLKAPWGTVVHGEPGQAAAAPPPPAASDAVQHSEVSAQVSGIYTSRSASAPVKHFDTHSAGLLLGYRYHITDWEAVEVEYGYTRNGQRYVTPPTTPGLPAALVGVPATMHEAVANEVITTPRLFGILQPFLLAGGGVLVFKPRSPSDISPVSTQTRPTGNFGVGFDFHIGHLGARAEYQGLFFKVPDFKNPVLMTNKYSLVSQPSAGLIFTF